MRSLRASFLAAAVALALFGLGRFVFNLVTLRIFGASFVGGVNVALSSWTVVTVLLGTVPAFVTSKFVAESAARGDDDRARRVFSAALALVTLPGVAIALAATLLRPEGALWVWYVPAFGAYLVVKAAAFAFGLQRTYLFAEVSGLIVFLTVCLGGCALSAPRIAAASLLLQPATIVVVCVWGLRDRLVWQGVATEVINGWSSYGLYWGAIFINAAAGLVSYHFAIVLAGAILVDKESVGYLSVLMSSLAPLNFLPAALGTSLFPELARRYAAGDEDGQRRAVTGSVLALQVLVLSAGAALLVAPEPFLRLMHVPAEGPVRTTWILLAWVLQLTIVSSPCGHFLNATRYAGRHAMASAFFLAIGLTMGIVGLTSLGLIGAGLMRIGVDAGLAWVRMVVAQKALRWMIGARGAVLGCQAGLAAAAVVGLLAPSWRWRVAIWLLGLATQFPAMRRAIFSSSTVPA